MKLNLSIWAILCCSLLFSCSKNTNIEPAFYYWKSDYNALQENEIQQIKELGIKKLYVKFFEVGNDSVMGPIPFSKSNLRIDTANLSEYYPDKNFTDVFNNIEIIPTVFIKNEVLLEISQGALDTLAHNINHLIEKRFSEHFALFKTKFNEIQIDCDWTPKSKENYFNLLGKLQQKSNKIFSCTLRLYPYKYTDKMGIPPVKKATLMCYNLTSPLTNPDKNSIQNNAELELYLKNVKSYPIHLDIALPVFSSVFIYQNNQFAGMRNWDNNSIDTASLKPIKPLWYKVIDNIVIKDFYLRPGDVVKIEDVTAKETLRTIDILKKHIRFDSQTTITLFHLDEKNLNKYDYETLRSFYINFTK